MASAYFGKWESRQKVECIARSAPAFDFAREKPAYKKKQKSDGFVFVVFGIMEGGEMGE